MAIKKVQFAVGDEVLAGNIISGSELDEPRLLLVHGAGQATKERARPFALKLAGYNISSFGFDFSGHGESTGKLEESSLYKRTTEAKEACRFLTSKETLTVCGFSMGGHIALELLKTEPIHNIILFYPAVYASEAFEVPFNKGFSEIIRREESWKRTDVLEALEAFSGNLFICIGENDEVIPKGIIDMLDGASKNTRRKEIMIIPNVNHQLAKWLAEHEEALDLVVEKILSFIA